MTAVPSSGPEVSTIGKYQLIANLGHGGMADVFLAVVHGPVGFNKLTVIKRLRPHLAEEPEFLAMFLDEARLAARLNHPNVVQTNEVAEVGGVYFLAMEFLDGQPLNRIFHRTAKMAEPPRELLLRVVADALAGLHHAHELADYDGTPLRVVHRDASPHNIFVTYDGQTKVVDFGIAKAATRSAETRGGVLKGKIAYMAPEQARGRIVDRRSDVFAMGLVLWEALTGTRLRRGPDHEILDGIRRGEVPKVGSVWPGCPEALEAVVARATAYAKEDRYATALEMRQDILAHLEATGARATSEDVGKLVSAQFQAKRAEMKAIIERQLSGLRRASTEEVGLRVIDARKLSATESAELPRVSLASMPPSSPGSGSGPAAGGSAGSRPSGRPSAPSNATATSTLKEGSQASRLRGPVMIGVAAVVAAATVFALRRGDERAAANGAAAASSASAATAAGAAASATAGDGTTATATIELRLSATPAQARMFLDDTALEENPFVGRFRRDERPHTVRVEAEGHTTVERPISFASSQTIAIALERAAAPPPAAHEHPEGRPAAAASESATASAAPAGDADDDLPKPGSPPRKELDSDDPWK